MEILENPKEDEAKFLGAAMAMIEVISAFQKMAK